MLLRVIEMTQMWIKIRLLAYCTLLCILLPMAAYTAGPESECFVRLPVYGPHGDHLPFRVASVRVDVKDGIDLLSTDDPKRHARADGEKFYFPKPLLHTPVRVTLQNDQGDIATGRIVLTSCKQRASLRYGELDSGGDVAWTSIRGRLSSCAFDGDWWIRATPMFGDVFSSPAFDGQIAADGTFSVPVEEGVRYIIIVGKGNQPVRTCTFDVTRGGLANDVGNIDLSGACPK